MKIAVVLAALSVAANIFLIWHLKKSNKAKPDESSDPIIGSYAFSKGHLNTPEARQLRKSAATELGLSIEELDRMLTVEIKQIAKEQEKINIE